MFVLDVCGDWLSDDLALVAEEADEDEALDPGLKTLTHAKLNLNQVAEKVYRKLGQKRLQMPAKLWTFRKNGKEGKAEGERSAIEMLHKLHTDTCT